MVMQQPQIPPDLMGMGAPPPDMPPPGMAPGGPMGGGGGMTGIAAGMQALGIDPTGIPGSPEEASQMQQDPMQALGLGAGFPGTDPLGMMLNTGAPPEQQSEDPILDMLLMEPATRPTNPELAKDPKDRKGYRPLPDIGDIRMMAKSDQELWRPTVERMGRDLTLYRQGLRAVPPNFDPKREVAFQSAMMSNLVNKLVSMSSSTEWMLDVPVRDNMSRDAAQVVADFARAMRREWERTHAIAQNGDIANEEWFYDYVHGRIAVRVLPDLDDTAFPFDVYLADPSTVFPVWGGKQGLRRLTRIYKATTEEVLADYGRFLGPDTREKILAKTGDGPAGDPSTAHREMEVVEYWDTWNRAVTFGDIEILPPVAHELGYVPWSYVWAKGEPAGLRTPDQGHTGNPDEYDNMPWTTTASNDLSEKGVSVFHHLINSNMLDEIMHTMLITEALKSQNPSVINYSAPQLAGKEPPPLNNKPGGNNQRILNLQRVEMVPTSPRPSDVAPVLNKIGKDLAEGSLPSSAFGNESGSNVSGFAVESLVASSKEATLPYQKCWERHMSNVFGIMLLQYRDIISPFNIMSIPVDGGDGEESMAALTPDMLAIAGTRVDVELFGISRQQMPAAIQTASNAVSAGIWSLDKAMRYLGEKAPDREFKRITMERAMQHPEMMETYIIPTYFLEQGADEMAKMWSKLVIVPKMAQMGAGGMGGGGGGGGIAEILSGMGGGGGGGAPPGTGPGMSPEMAGGGPPSAPGGPGPGEGRGPAR